MNRTPHGQGDADKVARLFTLPDDFTLMFEVVGRSASLDSQPSVDGGAVWWKGGLGSQGPRPAVGAGTRETHTRGVGHASSQRTGIRRVTEEERAVCLPGGPAGGGRDGRAGLSRAD